MTKDPAPGDRVSYRAIDGSFWMAKVLSVRENGWLDIEVGGNPPLRLLRVEWWNETPTLCPRRCCTDKAMAEQQR